MQKPKDLETIVTYLKPADRLAAKVEAAKHDMSLSSWVRDLIRRAVEEGAEGK